MNGGIDMDRDWIRALAFLSQIGITIAACIVVGVFLGRFLDQFFDTSPILTIICSLLGVGAAFKAIFDLASKE